MTPHSPVPIPLSLLLGVLLSCCATASSSAADFTLAGRTLTVAEGYSLELAAASPLAQFPVMAGFDERGRLFVGEASGVLAWKDAQPADKKADWHRLVRLADTDGDGRFDERRVLAQFDRPVQGVQVLHGVIYAAEALARTQPTTAQQTQLAAAFKNFSSAEMSRVFECFAKSSNDTVRPRAQPLLDQLAAADRAQLQRAERVLPLIASADTQRGLTVFQSSKTACLTCHIASLVGGHIGPTPPGLDLAMTDQQLADLVAYLKSLK